MKRREVECHLGDVPDGLEPKRPVRRSNSKGGETNWLHACLAIIGVTVFAALVLAVVFVLLLSARPAAAEPIKLPRVCIALAEDYGMTVPGGVMERTEIERHLDSAQVIAVGILISKVRRCRAAIKVELKK